MKKHMQEEIKDRERLEYQHLNPILHVRELHTSTIVPTSFQPKFYFSTTGKKGQKSSLKTSFTSLFVWRVPISVHKTQVY
jgi:hypothetical protein